MAAMTLEQMIAEINNYFDKIEQGGGGKFRNIQGFVPANGTYVYDAPGQIGYNATTHHIYSLGIELRMVDPFTETNPPVIAATAVLDYMIAADGKVTLRNNHNQQVTFYARITEPVKK